MQQPRDTSDCHTHDGYIDEQPEFYAEDLEEVSSSFGMTRDDYITIHGKTYLAMKEGVNS